jgi:hypothetical protein
LNRFFTFQGEIGIELREPNPEHILDLIADAERDTHALFATTLAIMDTHGNGDVDTDPSATRPRYKPGH